ncbi:endonuclease NucS domain-containing protein [uncultured Reyranella sp.]|uniref:endonuclease NucS domain-containing protein n=1 Tax=uncultured Reyranella sp. TaxID=735512 RepID=UPI0025F63623|nr:endonuclease NucS domain-containing protein [uncultured Reyranella sp.]
MAIRQAIWKVGGTPSPLAASSLPSEKALEEMIVAAPAILDDQWMLVGRQIATRFGGIIDLLALAPDGSLVLIELKRNRTPREVVAQALDYASYVASLKSEDLATIYSAFAPEKDLATEFRSRFGTVLDEDTLNGSHQIVVVAAELDDSTERIVAYLGDRGIPINVLFFQVFADGDTSLLSRAWLRDTAETQANAVSAASGTSEPWNGEYYVNFGQSKTRAWSEAVEYGFVSAGGGSWYSGALKRLDPGDRIWVKAPSYGFVGVGRVVAKAARANDFLLPTATGDRPALEVLKAGTYHREYADDPEKSEYFVPVKWLGTVPLEKAVNEVGLFGNQNTVAQPASPKWRHTIERLKQIFTHWDASTS